MNRKQLNLFRKEYDKSIKKCVKGKDKEEIEIQEQSDWVFFERATLEKLLAMTDVKTGGIKMYFGQYNEENLDMIPLDRPFREDYIGRLSLALSASNRTTQGIQDVYSADSVMEDQGLENGGTICPPDCNPY
jgi:hypothetical protein